MRAELKDNDWRLMPYNITLWNPAMTNVSILQSPILPMGKRALRQRIPGETGAIDTERYTLADAAK